MTYEPFEFRVYDNGLATVDKPHRMIEIMPIKRHEGRGWWQYREELSKLDIEKTNNQVLFLEIWNDHFIEKAFAAFYREMAK